MTHGELIASINLPQVSTEAYIKQVNSYEYLTQQQEFELAERLAKHNDLAAAQRLIFSHLRYVAKIAKGYMGYGLPLADLIQEGSIGLMKAVKRFDVKYGVRLVSFAVHWVKAEIHDYILKNWRIVKMATTNAQRKVFFKLRQSKTRLGWLNKAEMEDIAKDLGVTVKDISTMEQRLNANDEAYDCVSSDGGEGILTPSEYLSDENINHGDPSVLLADSNWSGYAHKKLSLALQQLDERSYDIIKSRRLQDPKATLQQLSTKYQVSMERVRQLEAAAFKKLRNILNDTLELDTSEIASLMA